MPPGPGTEHTKRALLKVLHLLTSTLWPPASFCRDREHQSHCCDLAHPYPLQSPPASYHADPHHPADDGVLLAVCLHHLLREEEIGFVVVPVIIVWDHVGCHKFGVYEQEPATSGARVHSHHLWTPHTTLWLDASQRDPQTLLPRCLPLLIPGMGDDPATARLMIPRIRPARGDEGVDGCCYH